MTDPHCAHTWDRARPGSGDIGCTDCKTPYVPPRSFSDLAIELHEESEHSPLWDEFGATPGAEEIEVARREAA